jgi:hypothetical protein
VMTVTVLLRALVLSGQDVSAGQQYPERSRLTTKLMFRSCYIELKGILIYFRRPSLHVRPAGCTKPRTNMDNRSGRRVRVGCGIAS